MKRFLLLLLIVTIIVAGLAWATSQPTHTPVAPPPDGPGEIASSGPVEGGIALFFS